MIDKCHIIIGERWNFIFPEFTQTGKIHFLWLQKQLRR